MLGFNTTTRATRRGISISGGMVLVCAWAALALAGRAASSSENTEMRQNVTPRELSPTRGLPVGGGNVQILINQLTETSQCWCAENGSFTEILGFCFFVLLSYVLTLQAKAFRYARVASFAVWFFDCVYFANFVLCCGPKSVLLVFDFWVSVEAAFWWVENFCLIRDAFISRQKLDLVKFVSNLEE